MELFWINGWLFVVHVDRESDTGTVYFPHGEPILSIAANFGSPGDSFPTREAAIEYFSGVTPD